MSSVRLLPYLPLRFIFMLPRFKREFCVPLAAAARWPTPINNMMRVVCNFRSWEPGRPFGGFSPLPFPLLPSTTQERPRTAERNNISALISSSVCLSHERVNALLLPMAQRNSWFWLLHWSQMEDMLRWERFRWIAHRPRFWRDNLPWFPAAFFSAASLAAIFCTFFVGLCLFSVTFLYVFLHTPYVRIHEGFGASTARPLRHLWKWAAQGGGAHHRLHLGMAPPPRAHSSHCPSQPAITQFLPFFIGIQGVSVVRLQIVPLGEFPMKYPNTFWQFCGLGSGGHQKAGTETQTQPGCFCHQN